MDIICCLQTPLPLLPTTPNKNITCSIFTSRRMHFRPTTTSRAAVIRNTKIDKSLLLVAESVAEDALYAAACLRVRTFYEVNNTPSIGIHEDKKQLVEREFKAVKERIAGKRRGIKRVSCINATLPLSHIDGLEDLCTACKCFENGEDRVVVGTLDLNQCIRLQDEATGMKPEGTGADTGRAYLSNVCVAKELQRNGLGCEIIAKAKIVAQQWGITDLYVHVDVDNEQAKQFYMKIGFTYESDEPALLARFLDRPPRVLLWHGLSTQNM